MCNADIFLMLKSRCYLVLVKNPSLSGSLLFFDLEERYLGRDMIYSSFVKINLHIAVGISIRVVLFQLAEYAFVGPFVLN